MIWHEVSGAFSKIRIKYESQAVVKNCGLLLKKISVGRCPLV